MEIRTDIPPPRSLSDLLRDIPAGASAWFPASEHKPATIRSTITRLQDGSRRYTTRPEREGLRVWRLL